MNWRGLNAAGKRVPESVLFFERVMNTMPGTMTVLGTAFGLKSLFFCFVFRVKSEEVHAGYTVLKEPLCFSTISIMYLNSCV